MMFVLLMMIVCAMAVYAVMAYKSGVMGVILSILIASVISAGFSALLIGAVQASYVGPGIIVGIVIAVYLK